MEQNPEEARILAERRATAAGLPATGVLQTPEAALLQLTASLPNWHKTAGLPAMAGPRTGGHLDKLDHFELRVLAKLADSLPGWYEKAGLPGVCAALLQVVKKADEAAVQAESRNDEPRFVIATKMMRTLTFPDEGQEAGGLST
ncbi:hypothetical protein LNV09_14445 [Paucibacter sp. B2R-40]|uniref:hypothetical protein n=1 Tax=Paucibacter sp. B2R-40 TaxID=2893554 RepID=UPI0021E4482B|nr:hypothetical protein [Paucibacter sp. B2R-40]MCV2355350.1 hypothetical protein [Paucibacter sp. B2R-40]